MIRKRLTNSNSNWKQNSTRNKNEAKNRKSKCDTAQAQVEVVTKDAEANSCTSEPKTADLAIDNWENLCSEREEKTSVSKTNKQSINEVENPCIVEKVSQWSISTETFFSFYVTWY